MDVLALIPESSVRQYWRQSAHNIMRNVGPQTCRRLSISVDKTGSDVDKEMLSPIQQPRNRLEPTNAQSHLIKAPACQGQRPTARSKYGRGEINRCKLLRKSEQSCMTQRPPHHTWHSKRGPTDGRRSSPSRMLPPGATCRSTSVPYQEQLTSGSPSSLRRRVADKYVCGC